MSHTEERFCEKIDTIVDQIMSTSRTVIFCLEPYLFRSVLKKIASKDTYVNGQDNEWVFLYLDIYQRIYRDSCYLWSGGVDDQYSCMEQEPFVENIYCYYSTLFKSKTNKYMCYYRRTMDI